ncbi:MAG: GNAT family N-acetyltransferase [Solirubrobacterales bacterium]|nr:GNAT family N-acetyltransferase [Solirubrobacterales bacterium]
MDPAERRTARLRLRRPRLPDIPGLVALHLDPRVNEHRPGGPPSTWESEQIVQGFLEAWEREGIGYWLLERNGAVIGVAGVVPFWLADQELWNLYFRLSPAAWGQGLAGEAAREALAVAARLAPGRPVVVQTRPDNVRAIGVARGLAMKRRPDLDHDGFVVFAT